MRVKLKELFLFQPLHRNVVKWQNKGLKMDSSRDGEIVIIIVAVAASTIHSTKNK